MKPSLLFLSAILFAGCASAADEPGVIGSERCKVINSHPEDDERIACYEAPWCTACARGDDLSSRLHPPVSAHAHYLH